MVHGWKRCVDLIMAFREKTFKRLRHSKLFRKSMPQTWPRRTLNRPSVYAKRQPMMPISISGLIAKQWRGNSPYPSQGRWAIPVRSEAISCGSLVLTGTNLEGLKSQVLISWLMNSHFCLFSRCQQETMSLLLPGSWLYL